MFYVEGQLVEPTGEKPENNSKNGGKEHKFICLECGAKSLSINDESYLYKCWSCGVKGKAMSATDQPDTTSKPREVTDWSTQFKAQEKKKSKQPSAVTTDKYIRMLVKESKITPTVNKYLQSHGIPLEYAQKYGIGYCATTPDYPDKEIAEILGLINERGNNRMYKRIIFPIRKNKRFVYVQGRSQDKESKAKFLNMHSTAPMFNSEAIAAHDKVYVCEGIPDCLAMIAAGHENSVAVLGAQSFTSEIAESFENKDVTLLFDGDKAGSAGSKRATKKLIDVANSVVTMDIPDGMDVAECIANGKDVVEDDDKRSTHSDGEEPDGTRRDSRGERERILTYVRSESNLLVFGYGGIGKGGDFDIVIEVSNVVERKTSLKASVQFTFAGDKEYGGSVDLASIRSRATFSKELAEQFKVNELEIKVILNDLNIGVRSQVTARKEEKVRNKEYVMSEDEKQEAIEFLKSDRLLFKIKEALTRQNIIGEDVNKILLYLIFTSRIMKKPVSSIIKGLSSSGKTYLMSKTVTLMPPEGIHVMQDATAKAFHYLDEDGLRHKMIVIGEMHGSEDSSYTIREAQDGIGNGDLIILTVEKDPDTNSMVTKEKRVKGPCGFVTSTTNPELHSENETRNFSLFVQVSAEKVRITGQVLVDKYLGNSTEMSEDELKVYHNAQRCLSQGVSVRIPYISHVLDRFPTDPIRVMRDRERFFTIIETIALLHQFQREIFEDAKGNPYIESTIEDYYIALTLLNEILIETLYELPPKSKEIYDTVVEMKHEYEAVTPPPETLRFDDPEYEDPWAGDEKGDPFFATYKTLAEVIKMKPREVKRWAKPLFENGYLQHLDNGQKRGRGRETHMIPTEKTFYQTFLPSPEEVCGMMGLNNVSVYDPITGEVKEIVLEQPEEEEIPF